MPHVANWLHCVWGTKRRHPYLTKEIKNQILNHILQNAKEKKIYIDSLDGSLEHLHCLISLDPDMSLSNVMQLIKGESSHWINKQKLTDYKFEWAVDYYAASISRSHLPRVRRYIATQEEHHKIQSWPDEVNELIIEYGFTRYPDSPRTSVRGSHQPGD
jgi:REP element-mobilizing transposase RayT